MSGLQKLASVGVMCLCLVGCAGKESVTGIWKGKINVPEKYKNDAATQARVASMGSTLLDLKGDGTFTLSLLKKMAGTWTEKENELTLKVTTLDGEPLASLQGMNAALLKLFEEIKVSVSENRRELTMNAPGMDGSIQFTR